MVPIDDEDEHSRHDAETNVAKVSSQRQKCNYAATINGSDKRNTTYLHFLRKTRRKSNKLSFKATTPTSNARKCQALSAYWQMLLIPQSKSFNGNRRFDSFHSIKSLQSLQVKESAREQAISYRCTSLNQLSSVGQEDSREIKRYCGVNYSKSEVSLRRCGSIALAPAPRCRSSESQSAAVREYELQADLKPFRYSKSSGNSRSRYASCDWSEKFNSYIIRSNTNETNGSYRRRPQSIERLCKRKKRRLRRRRKRKAHRKRQLHEEKEEEDEEERNHNTIATFGEQLAVVHTTAKSATVVAFNAHETHKSAIVSHAQPATTCTPTTAATTQHDTLVDVSTIAAISSPMPYTTGTHAHKLPATKTLPKHHVVVVVVDCHERSNSSCCNGNTTGVQHHSRSSNKMATINTCTTAKSAMSSTSYSPTAAAAFDAASPAIRLSAFYAATTLRLFLTTLTTLIASTTPTTFTATKYSWIFLWIYVNLTARVGLAGYHEKRLLHDLLDPYNTLERPVLNESDPLQLSFGLTLMQIIDVDEKNQLLVTNVWLKLEWNDMNLRWNTSDYGGVKDLRIPPHRIWKPDVLMYNSADEGFDGTYQTNVVVRNNGSCLYVPPGIFKSTCKIDITWFPFDDQRCEMKFGSWTYDGFQV
ncbi:PREDICTED: uncharacterized protein LOC108361814 [Rhagoletis zephyria]|uniref:uncharacterized protein LOC108361814 n=1 Tax=Rhagoletis zephyria TaxID=28612 RepID=UPI00081154EE|nr:PREDICTED: uncharacterized protein LOC108361814 [Rhagoletis zephyria]